MDCDFTDATMDAQPEPVADDLENVLTAAYAVGGGERPAPESLDLEGAEPEPWAAFELKGPIVSSYATGGVPSRPAPADSFDFDGDLDEAMVGVLVALLLPAVQSARE